MLRRRRLCGALQLLLLQLCVAASRRGDPPRYRTAYACEGSQLRISCDEGHLVQLIRANYGRFSISICNEHGTLDWSVDCMSPRSFRVMQQSCDVKKGCTLPASTDVFGDPCPGTLKYLEAHYQCIPAELTTASSAVRPTPLSPGDLLPPTLGSEQQADRVVPRTPPPLPAVYQRPADLSTTTVVPTDAVETSSTAALELLYCQPMVARDIFWNWTRAGDVAVYPCPGGSKGDARWQCGVNPVKWLSDRPDLSGCNSFWVGDLEQRISGGTSVVNLGSELSQKTRVKSLYGGDLLHMTSIVQQLLSKMEDELDHASDSYQRQQVVEELMNSVVDFSSNLLERHQGSAWADLPPMEQRAAASSLLEGLERNAMLMVKSHSTNLNYSRLQNNIMATVKVLSIQSVTDMTFPDPSIIRGTSWSDSGDSIYLPYKTLLESARNGVVKVAFFSYRQMESILSASNPTDAVSNSTVRLVNSRVVAAALGRRRVLGLTQPVLITLKHSQEENVSDPQCVFWDFSKRDWSERGCWVDASNETHTVCACDHLTNFAVLMDVRSVQLTHSNELALQVITYAGCFVSIVCLVLTIITYQLFRVLESERMLIHKNLCVCLLVAEVVFVAGISQTAQRTLCGIVAGLLHYFFLAAFLWMFLEGFQLYVMLIEVFDSEKSRLGWYYTLAYGLPAVIVTVAAAIDPASYGTPQHCWLRADNYFILSFIGPVVAILLANLVFLSIAVYMMCRHSSLASSVKNKEQSKMVNFRIWIRSAAVLVVLLGLTWGFGLLYLNAESVAMAYLFTFLNSLQGLFIFVFHCLRNDKVRKEYKQLVEHWPWLPSCLRSEKSLERPSFTHSNGTAHSAPSCGGLPHSLESQFWCPPKNSDSVVAQSSSLRSTTLGGHPSTRMPLDTRTTPRARGAILVLPRQSGCDGNELHPPPYGHYRNPDVYLDHIYETIDPDESPAHGFKGPEEECHSRSRSDASQSGSSSLLGCDRRPLIRHAFHQRTEPATELASADPALVMAVFEGDRVKCRLQLVDGRPTMTKHPCQPSAHLSTDC
ncbi:adhesion G protein-coupled receptor L1 isoform X2 [Rhipicephalus sanguineus]|uniref:adhesion G protein-coupled receptor L1 isoform X2 n=1 Tax=Rhipicephalus sanguineus TaxID=34632 RepID=UPI001893D830|nr:adhesion G protein-coupled receptor L1 isoform X2 [Rhipicephalus sanguineus]